MMPLMKLITAGTVSLAVLASGSSSGAHEFWIDLERGRIAPGEQIRADLKVGRMLEGVTHPYLSSRFTSFDVGLEGKRRPVRGIEGDIPAMAATPLGRGLHVIGHRTIAFRAAHQDWALFRTYLAEEGYDHLAGRHGEGGLAKTGFAERYTRYAKALVQVGEPRGNDGDRSLGLPLELVAGNNPYDPGAAALDVTLLWRGRPLAGRRLNVFHGATAVSRTSLTTDAEGKATIPLAGAGAYLLSAVLLLPVEDQPVAWASHWASLSFKLPGR